MTPDPKALVPLTACGSNLEASLLRTALESRGIYCFVQAEIHRSLLPGVQGAYIEPRVLVRREDLAAAHACLLERQHVPAAAAPDPELETMRQAQRQRMARRLAFFPSFGAAHHYSGAHVRGLVFGAVQVYGLYLACVGMPLTGLALVALCIATDFVTAPALAASSSASGGSRPSS